MSWVAVGLTTVVAGTSLYGGISANKSAKMQASLIEKQGALLRDEALVEAANTRVDGYRFKQEQMMQYVGAGVEISGTPLLLMKETEKSAEFEAQALEKRGQAEMELASGNAKVTRAEGKARLIASIGNAVGSGVSTYNAAKGK